MNIAHITGTFPPYFGGVGNVCYHNALELANMGHEVTVYTSNYPKGHYSYPKILRVKRLNYPFQYGKSPFLPGLLNIKDFDIFHLHFPFYFGSEMVYIASKIRKFNYILTYHMDIPLRYPTQGIRTFMKIHDRFVNRKIICNAKKIIVTSLDYALHSRMKDIFKKRREDIIEVPNGVDLNNFHTKRNCGEIRKKYGINEDERIIFFVGALDTQHYFKGLDYLLKAFSMLKRDDVRLLIVGDGDLKNYYVNLARKLNIMNQTVFTGRVEHIPNYYAAADFEVLPSIDMSEAFGLVLVEAMASGKPVIASNLPGVRTVIDNGYNGLLVEPRNTSDILLKMTYLLDHDKVAKRFGDRGRKKAEQKYSWKKIAKELHEIYLEAI